MPLFGKKKDKTHPETSHHHEEGSSDPFADNTAYREPGYSTQTGPTAGHSTGAGLGAERYGTTSVNDPHRMAEPSFDSAPGGYGSSRVTSTPGHTAANTAPSHGLSHGGGSETLKARGMEKEREAEVLRSRGDELAEAERLEREAHKLRERATGGSASAYGDDSGARNRRGFGGEHGRDY